MGGKNKKNKTGAIIGGIIAALVGGFLLGYFLQPVITPSRDTRINVVIASDFAIVYNSTSNTTDAVYGVGITTFAFDFNVKHAFDAFFAENASGFIQDHNFTSSTGLGLSTSGLGIYYWGDSYVFTSPSMTDAALDGKSNVFSFGNYVVLPEITIGSFINGTLDYETFALQTDEDFGTAFNAGTLDKTTWDATKLFLGYDTIEITSWVYDPVTPANNVLNVKLNGIAVAMVHT